MHTFGSWEANGYRHQEVIGVHTGYGRPWPLPHAGPGPSEGVAPLPALRSALPVPLAGLPGGPGPGTRGCRCALAGSGPPLMQHRSPRAPSKGPGPLSALGSGRAGHRLQSIVPMYGASTVRFVITSSALAPASAILPGAPDCTGVCARPGQSPPPAPSRGGGPCRQVFESPAHDPEPTPDSPSATRLNCPALTNRVAVPLPQRTPDQHRMLP